MKGDFTRETFDPAKHYQQVLMQQGRVQLDADWNEQAAITQHRHRATTEDIVGHCGGPADNAAFGVLPAPPPGEPAAGARDFYLSAGHYYVHGLLCEVEKPFRFSQQPDCPSARALLGSGGDPDGEYLVYLDVWQRHLTALEDPAIREPALGGPDTGTRVKTIWQVRAAKVTTAHADVPCRSTAADFEQRQRGTLPELAARALPPGAEGDPCELPATAGYRGLENQLYRVEVHDEGAATTPTGPSAGRAVPGLANGRVPASQLTASGWPTPAVGQAYEFFSVEGSGSAARIARRELAWVTRVDGSEVVLSHHPRLTGVVRAIPAAATWKWSRDNGAVVYPLKGTTIEAAHPERVTLGAEAPDAIRALHAGDWVEVLNDELELEGRPGQMLRVVNPDDAGKVVLSAALVADFFPGGNLGTHPRLRRWEDVAPVAATPGSPAWLPLEQGVEVAFQDPALVRTGDYWLIPARTATPEAISGDIEWPRLLRADGRPDPERPIPQPPRGIVHHFCSLGIVRVTAGVVDPVADCRCLWPALTAPRLEYAGGDGQEVMPNPAAPTALVRLPQPLSVFVANLHCAAEKLTLQFEVTPRTDQLQVGPLVSDAAGRLKVPGARGLIACDWSLDPTHTTPDRWVRVSLVNEAGTSVEVPPPLRLTANLSIASQVGYDPGDCTNLAGKRTVQDAIDHLARQVSLHPISPLHWRCKPGEDTATLEVLVANRCGPRNGIAVFWEVHPATAGAASPNSDKTVSGDASVPGQTRVTFRLDPGAERAVILASLVDPTDATAPSPLLAAPSSLAFVIERPLQTLEPGLRVVDVRFQDGTTLLNDHVAATDAFFRGIQIELNQSASSFLDDSSVETARPVFFVTVDVPIRQSMPSLDRSVLVGYYPVILSAKVRTERTRLIWEPDDAVRGWLLDLFKNQDTGGEIKGAGLRVRVTVKGRFVWEEEDPSINLDGEAFGWPADRRIDLDLRRGSGDGRRGGDFEMWFWIRPDAPRFLSYRPGWSLIAYPTLRGENTVQDVFRGVSLLDGTQFGKFTPGRGFSMSVFEFGEWSDPGLTFRPGEGAAFFNPSLEPVLVPLGDPTETQVVLDAGLNLVGNPILDPATAEVIVGTSLHPNTTLYRLLGRSPDLGLPGSGGGYRVYTFDSELGGWSPEPPLVGIGEGVFIDTPRPVPDIRGLGQPRRTRGPAKPRGRAKSPPAKRRK